MRIRTGSDLPLPESGAYTCRVLHGEDTISQSSKLKCLVEAFCCLVTVFKAYV